MSLALPPILVVDDEKNMRLSLEAMLTAERYAVQAVESAEAALARVPVILLAALDRPITDEVRAAAGVVGCVTKPIRRPELLRALHAHLPRAADGGTTRSENLDAAGAAGRPARADAVTAAAFAGVRVLVAEDNVVNQRLTRLQLQKLGLQADLAADGREVLEAVERMPYDVILMDCQMPEIDGFEATRRLRASGRHPGLRIIAMTANAMTGDRERCLEAGMDDYLSKPTRLDDLRAVLERVMVAPPPAS